LNDSWGVEAALPRRFLLQGIQREGALWQRWHAGERAWCHARFTLWWWLSRQWLSNRSPSRQRSSERFGDSLVLFQSKDSENFCLIGGRPGVNRETPGIASSRTEVN